MSVAGQILPTAVTLQPHIEIEYSTIRFDESFGSRGAVRAGTLVTDEAVAIKQLTGPKALEVCNKQCGKHTMLHHPNIVRVCGMSKDGWGHAYIITELAPRGSLADALKSHPQRNDWATLVRWALDIANGLQYLHSLKPPMLHLDLKPHNVLLFDDGTVKLCDFGIVTSETQCLPQYAAPEQYATKLVSEATDVYGFGGVLFAMITKTDPWEGLSIFQICGNLMSGNLPSLPSPLPVQCPAKLAAVVQRCLQIDPQRRCSLSQAIEDLAQVLRELVPSPAAALGPPASADTPSLLDILKLFQGCPTPPGRSDIPMNFQNPTLEAIVAEYKRVEYFIPRSNFISDRAHEDAMAVGLYTDESFVYWLMNAWANDTSAKRKCGLRHVGPFMCRLAEALPRCCAHYNGLAVRVLKAGGKASQAMRDALADYERQYAAGTLLSNSSFASFTRGGTPIKTFTSDSHVLLFCNAVEGFDVDAYSMVRIMRHSEMEVLCLAPSAFRVSCPPSRAELVLTPSKTEWVVSVYTDMEAAPEGHPSTVVISARHQVQNKAAYASVVGQP